MGVKKSKTKYTSAIRIKNKTRKLTKRLKTLKKEESIEHIKRDCKIGRVKEGFKQEDFKHKAPKEKKVK